MIITFSPVVNKWLDGTVVNKPFSCKAIGISLTELTDGVAPPLSINIVASLTTPLKSTNNLSSLFAPTLNPWVNIGGLIFSVSNPNKYNFVELTLLRSIDIQSIFSSSLVIALGGIICVMNALSSFSNASFLNPSDTRANCPKFELELVIDASAPDWASKWVWYPIANTDTICRIELLLILTCLVSHPLL